MSDVNSVILVGRLVEKPIIKYAASGTAVSNLRIANNIYSKSSENNTKANFFTVVVFGKQAENCEKYLDKGRQIIINGRLDQSSWEDDSGKKRSTVKVIANSVQFIGGSPSSKNTISTTEMDQSQDEPMITDTSVSDFDSKFESPIDDADDNIPF